MSERIGLEGVIDLSQFTGNLNVYMNGVKQMKTETVNTAAAVTKASPGINIFSEVAIGAYRRVGEAATEFLGLAISKTKEWVGESISGALEGEQSLTRLNQTIKATGGIAGLSTSEALELGEAFHTLAGGSDDVVLGIINVGLQLGTIAEDEMPAFIQASLDLGAVMGDATKAAELLGFAQEQPTAAAKRLRAANILFTDSENAAIKAMEDAGNTAGAFALIMDKVSAATGGAAQANLNTLTGKIGLFKTTIAEAGESIFGAFIPAAHALFDQTLAPAIPVIENVSSAFADLITSILSGEATKGFESFRTTIAETLGETAANATDWGRNILVSLANGIIEGIGAVLDALTSVANVIAFWLSPGSPPRLLPDLPDWGASAMNEFLGGFMEADFGAFRDLSGQFESFVRQLGEDIIPETGLVPLILGGRDAIAEAIARVKEVGAVTDDIIAGITSAFGPAGGALQDYTRALLESEVSNRAVIQAQEKLNAVTAEYDALLNDVDDSISQIDNAQQDIRDEQRKTFLQAILLDPNASAAKKANARLELERIAADKRKRTLLTEKKQAVDNAQTELDAAKAKQLAANEELARQKSLLAIQMEQNKLLKEQADLLEKLASAGGGGGGAPAGGGGGKGVPKIAAPALPGGGLADLANVDDTKAKLLGGLDSLLEPIKTKFEAMKTAVSAAWNAVVETFGPPLRAIGETFREVLGINMPVIIENLQRLFQTFVTDVGAFWHEWGDEIVAVATFLIQALIAGIGGGLSIITSIFEATSILVSGVWEAMNALIRGDTEEAWTIINNAIDSALDEIAEGVAAFFDSALSIVDSNLGEFLDIWDGNLELLKMLVKTTFENVVEAVQTGITNAINGALELIGDFVDIGEAIIDGIVEGIQAAATNLVKAAVAVVNDALSAVSAALGNPRSPSPVTRKRAGLPFSEGIAAGVMDGLKLIHNASLSAATAMLAPVGAGSSVSNTTNKSTTYNLTENYNTGPKDSVRSFMTMKARARG